MSISELYQIFLKYPTVTTDTRKITENSIFFALKGDNFNGNAFAEKALESGAAFAVIDEEQYNISDRTILVDDVLSTLQQLATHHRAQLDIPVIGITGSNGKTTTKELTHSVLSQKYNCYATRGNLNNHIGVPLSILEINKAHEIAIIEMGANHVGEIAALCPISQPTIGLITNIGKAHLEGFGGFEGVKKAKSELYDYLRNNDRPIFINGDNEILGELAEGIIQITYGQSESNLVIGKAGDGNTLSILWKKQNFISHHPEVRSNLVGQYNLENALAAICIGDHFSVSVEQTKTALESYMPNNNRSQLLKKGTNQLILDAYNANPVSMNAAIDNILNYDQEKVVILGDMKELGEYSLKEHQEIVDKILDNELRAYLVGVEFSKTKLNGIPHFNSTEELQARLSETPISHSTILIKGSRSIGLEKIVDIL